VGELAMSCSCPDYAVPCKHIAATFYLLAEAFDEDPFQILRWRGRAREALLSRLRELRSAATADPSEAPSAGEATRAVGAAAALGAVPAPPPTDALDRFWLPPVPLSGKPQPVLTTDPDLLLRQLPTPGPQLGGRALTDALRPLYRRFG